MIHLEVVQLYIHHTICRPK